ncbi:MAG: acyl-CoA dehydrogenase family protein [Balneolales bacterium]
MSEPTLSENSISPLTKFTEDEQMLKEASADFAEIVIAPLVYTMDQQGSLDSDLIKACFEQGLMGIEIPGEYGGAGGSFFMAILAIELLF